MLLFTNPIQWYTTLQNNGFQICFLDFSTFPENTIVTIWFFLALIVVFPKLVTTKKNCWYGRSVTACIFSDKLLIFFWIFFLYLSVFQPGWICLEKYSDNSFEPVNLLPLLLLYSLLLKKKLKFSCLLLQSWIETSSVINLFFYITFN